LSFAGVRKLGNPPVDYPTPFFEKRPEIIRKVTINPPRRHQSKIQDHKETIKMQRLAQGWIAQNLHHS
jgi:hypothetical protein